MHLAPETQQGKEPSNPLCSGITIVFSRQHQNARKENKSNYYFLQFGENEIHWFKEENPESYDYFLHMVTNRGAL